MPVLPLVRTHRPGQLELSDDKSAEHSPLPELRFLGEEGSVDDVTRPHSRSHGTAIASPCRELALHNYCVLHLPEWNALLSSACVCSCG